MKGPWTAELTDTPYEELGESWVVDGPDGSICTLDGPRDEREEAARLIAAAPELLEALETVLRYRSGEGEFRFAHLPDDERSNACFDAWQEVEARATAALRKARGETS